MIAWFLPSREADLFLVCLCHRVAASAAHLSATYLLTALLEVQQQEP